MTGPLAVPTNLQDPHNLKYTEPSHQTSFFKLKDSLIPQVPTVSIPPFQQTIGKNQYQTPQNKEQDSKQKHDKNQNSAPHFMEPNKNMVEANRAVSPLNI